MKTIAWAAGFFLLLSATAARAVPMLSFWRLFEPPFEEENVGTIVFPWDYSTFWNDPPGGSSVDYHIVGPPGRFTPRSGHLTFPSSGANYILVGVIDDDIPGEDFAISMIFTNAVNLGINGNFTIYIRDNDRRSITVFGGTVTEGHAGTKQMPFTITQSGAPLSVPFSFNYTTTGGTAVAGQDYTAVTGTATIPAGETSTTVNVSVTGDAQVESNETIELSLSNLSLPVEGVVTAAPGTILNDDFPRSITVTGGSVVEGNTGTKLLPFTITQSEPPLSVDFSFNYTTTGGTAVAGQDYTMVNGSATIPAGESSTTVYVSVTGDIQVESDETIGLTLSNHSLPVANVTATPGTILNDDFLRSITVTGGTVAEGNTDTKLLPFTITQSEPPLSADFSFNYTTTGGTAVAGQDYTMVNGSATIPAGASSTTVYVSVTDDTRIELDETIELSLSNLSLPVEGVTATPGTILNDDFAPGPVPSATLVTEAQGTDTAQAWFAVDLSAPLDVAYSSRVSTRNGTALAGSDYNPLAPATVTFAPGETRKWVAITVKASAVPEASEKFYLDVEALDSHEVKSAECTIERLAITDFWRPSAGIFALRFPAGLGQRYVIEEAATPNAGWTPVSSLLSGTGFPVTQFVFADATRRFFRVRTTLPLAPGTPAAGS